MNGKPNNYSFITFIKAVHMIIVTIYFLASERLGEE